MPRGKVKWFNDDKGFGFIIPDGGGPDVFVHFRFIKEEKERGWRTLEEGEEVEYDVRQDPRGPQAYNVVRLNTGTNQEPS